VENGRDATRFGEAAIYIEIEEQIMVKNLSKVFNGGK
jgi:hypothetical protein